jgi:hypothetical protein
MAKRKAKRVRKDFQRKLDERRAYYNDQMKQLQIKKSETAKNDLVGALLLCKQFHSPACWRTVEVAERESTTNSKQRKTDSIVQKNKS